MFQAEIKPVEYTKNNIHVLQLLDRSLFNNSWSEEQWKHEFDNSFTSIYIMTNKSDNNIGFMTVSTIDQTLEIRKIGILLPYQRQGLASIFMNKVYQLSKENNIQRIILEVNEKNNPAVMFYKKSGFQIFNQRRNYYAPDQNALCMQKYFC